MIFENEAFFEADLESKEAFVLLFTLHAITLAQAIFKYGCLIVRSS